MKKPIQAVAVSSTIAIDYYWRCESFKKEIPTKLLEALEETAEARISEMMGQGYLSGELIDYVNMDIPGRKTPEDGWECHGWWNLKKEREPSPEVSTVNVIEIRGGEYDIQSLCSYRDDKEGNAQAEARFKALVTENHKVSKAVMEASLENGYHEEGEWKVLLVHSS
ncbi:MAG: hypothetical protein M0R32_02630 [Candidatus Cloacimonetes bacterium]|jgi:uncharacterized protein YoaH (UPF0181 family)|nr:hypothetical protein [Candidatus Cloacimonadota bacterium]